MKPYREIPKDKILKFKATPGFKGWEHFFTDESVSHPAKMNLYLLRYILRTYTVPGDVVLDPMAGTGSTVILAGAMGRHGIAVEYEPKFCKMIEENISRTEKYHTFTPGGKMTCIQGDARELSKHLGESDVIISSPPYGNRLADVAVQDGDSARMGYRQAVDVVLTSPPYSQGLRHRGQNFEEVRKKLLAQGFSAEYIKGHWNAPHQSQRWAEEAYGEDGENIGNIKSYGKVDTIVSSPPYGSDNANLQAREDKSAKSILASTGVRAVELEPDNLGNLKYGEIDSIITSPPYEGIMDAKRHVGGINDRENLRDAGGNISLPVHYSDSEDNIGNLKGETYLEAMIRVYRESYKVLKPLGKIVLVTKNFIRNKSVVRLDLDTIKLCESVGFRLIDHLYFELPTKSFWKILYHKKYPGVSEVLYEDVLVFEKPMHAPEKE